MDRFKLSNGKSAVDLGKELKVGIKEKAADMAAQAQELRSTIAEETSKAAKPLAKAAAKAAEAGSKVAVKLANEKPQIYTFRIERVEGSFGMSLNDHNRINSVSDFSDAMKKGVKSFDRITHVDGVELKGKISDMVGVKGQQAIMVTIERPPVSMHAAIAAHENADGDVYEGSKAMRPTAGPASSDKKIKADKNGGGPGPRAATPPRDEGVDMNTVTLLKGEGDTFGLELNMENMVILVDQNTPAHKSGIKVGDTIQSGVYERFRKPLASGPLRDVLPKIPADQAIILTYKRGIGRERPISMTEHAVSGEL